MRKIDYVIPRHVEERYDYRHAVLNASQEVRT